MITRSFRRFAAKATLVLLFAQGLQGAENAGGTIVLKAARLFDGKANALVQNGVVVVHDGKIIDVGANIAIPQDAQVIDFGDATLSPGFIDCHTHLTADYSKPYNERRLNDLQTELPLTAYEAIPLAEQ
nr:hypothetical protein [Verrucomicrobiota bacterium]